MDLKHREIVIPNDEKIDAFLNCKLDRKKYADVLTSIISSYSNGFVLAIDNKWGTGKTTFVKMWNQQLKNQKYQTLYFNAWENDFQEEVMIALLSELEGLRNKGEETFTTLVEKSTTFLKKILPSVVKGVAGKVVGDDAINEVVGAVTEFTVEEVELQMKNYNEKKKGINDFRKALEKFVEKVDEDKPVIFIIDELDRCRPRYAVEVLEQIKHLFSVPGIVFVLSIDKVQLGNAVRGFYGSDLIEADDYLRRFIDLEYSIPEPNKQLMVDYLFQYYNFHEFFSVDHRKRSFPQEEINFKNFANTITRDTNFSLRKMEKLFSLARVALRTTKVEHRLFPDLFLLLIFFKIEEESVFKDICKKKYNVQELIDLVENYVVSSYQNNQEVLVNCIITIALAYHNYLNEGVYPNSTFDIEKDERGEIIKVNYKSKFSDKSENYNLVDGYLNLRSQVTVSKLNLKPILDKILLLNSINT
ncbi:KAP family P-loop NTPase fold protein [Winogradskyella wichelsiae]|uniref:KAP family P-loop NTPase fold protein n=1 Tax=Winogradskyella wichelsiae TaxID=2697007 RepID=UPI0015CBE013|nr:P-loop NTPase fold protein [Winogradskyella wichelsiae]